jgi:hypothetical protein
MNRDKLLRKYLDGELSPQEEKEALHVIADDDELRSMLRFEQQLNSIISSQSGALSSSEVPKGFSENVMNEIAGLEQQQKEGFLARLKDWYQELWEPKQVQWRPAYSFVVAVLILFAFTYPLFIADTPGPPVEQAANMQDMDQSVQQISTGAEEVMLRFVYIDDEASSVAVAGDFSDWEPIELNRMQVNGEQVWSGIISMSRGEHNYMFIKDGSEWITDPMAPVTRDDGFGNKNAVVYL